jgi:toxin ParE1/3/4
VQPREATIRARLSGPAVTDLKSIADRIWDRADEDVGEAYVRRIETHCRRLIDFPRRGRPRDEFGPGVRSISLERRATILYRIEDDEVTILSILYAGREPGPAPR